MYKKVEVCSVHFTEHTSISMIQEFNDSKVGWVRRFPEKFIPGTGRAKHPGNDLLVDSRACLPDASPLQG